MTEYDEASESLKSAQRRVHEALIAASGYVEARAAAGDVVAQVLAESIESAFDSMRAENIAAATLVEGKQ